MGRPLDYEAAREVLTTEYELAEALFRENESVDVSEVVADAVRRVFESKTESHREVLIGLAIARILDPEIDISLPYMNLGKNAFNARELDQRIVNPFLRFQAIPCTTGPYLNTFRRSVAFDFDTARGVRDKRSYAGLMNFISELVQVEADVARTYLRFLMLAFINLREAANIALVDIRRVSLDQYEALVDNLLMIPSGGRLPVLLAVATYHTLSECYICL